ncbi:winged helix-turn-helix transcriptional regulator [Snodgrassella gandavensis]|uniref:winged helix-turn-helix transcriptional regulator n=1 Tax=Snodgrassella gandavensis TaxID=2946698 RepID=UPI0034DECA67
MKLIGARWKGVILYYLRDQSQKFGELRKNIPDITEMTLKLTAQTTGKRWFGFSNGKRG